MKLEHDLFQSIGVYTAASGTDDKLPQKKTSNDPFKIRKNKRNKNHVKYIDMHGGNYIRYCQFY